jgi:hypothetical protein
MTIYTVQYNMPEYVDLQNSSFKRHIKMDHRVVVLDNSASPELKAGIMSRAIANGCVYQDCNNTNAVMSSNSHQNALRVFAEQAQVGEVSMLVDHDVFMVGDLTQEYLSGELMYVPQSRGDVDYPWPGLVIFNPLVSRSGLDFSSGVINGHACDTGGMMHHYIKGKKTKEIGTEYVNEGSRLMAVHDGIFLHLISGSGWNGQYDLIYKLDTIRNNAGHE